MSAAPPIGALAPAWAEVARTSLLSDAMDLCALPENAAGGFRLLGARRVAIGRAVTVQQALIGPEGGVARQGEIALAAPPGAVLVVATPSASAAVSWGDAHTLRAMAAGLAGVVLGGALRDCDAIAKRALPVLCRGTSPLRSAGRLITAATAAPVTVAGVAIGPGDIVCLDADGLVAIPQAHEDSVLEAALARRAWEATRDRDLEARLAMRDGAERGAPVSGEC